MVLRKRGRWMPTESGHDWVEMVQARRIDAHVRGHDGGDPPPPGTCGCSFVIPTEAGGHRALVYANAPDGCPRPGHDGENGPSLHTRLMDARTSGA